jgi:putative hydrolase of the HAD superfamily
MTQRPEAVIFDLYETLITHFNPHRTPRPSVARRLGIDDDVFLQVWRRVYDDRNSGTIPDYRSALRQVVQSLGRSPDEALLQRLDEDHTAGHRRLFLRIEDEIVQMLATLQGASMTLGLISNTTPEEVMGWEDCELMPYFGQVVFSYQVGLVKPDARIYRLACERLGVSPSRALFVGDGGDNELAGAAEAGLVPYWATWFLQRWPDWEARFDRPDARRFRRLKSPAELVDLVAADSVGQV